MSSPGAIAAGASATVAPATAVTAAATTARPAAVRYEKGARYVITRDGGNVAALAAGVTSLRDTNVKPGAGYPYQVVPVPPEGGAPQARLYGVRVSVPASGSLTGQRAQAAERATGAWAESKVPRTGP
ncbi:hypothetical protein [Streptomyces sp. LN704]|uniref:hypothetical protein n=1 Tax=unclassified Streptomyces TaxID=2593676 RepID=UPI003715BB70